jgi:hypothetical protein
MPLRPISAANSATAAPASAGTKPAADERTASTPPDSRSGQGGFMEGLKQIGRAPVAKAFSKGVEWLRGPSLDLRGHDPEAIQQAAPRSARFLAKVKTVRLPEGTTSTPQWMAALPKLKKLDARGFAGEELALQAPKLTKVKAPPATQVENRTNARKKTLVKHIVAGETVGTSTAIGRVYLSKSKAESSDNLNGEVAFPGRRGELIWCRHIALREIFDAQRYDARKEHGLPATGRSLRALLDAERAGEEKARRGEPTRPARRADVRHELMGTRSRMSRHIDESVETRYHEIKRCSTENYLLSHEKWGELISNKFANMPKPGQVSLLLETNKHAMAMFLSAKRVKDQAPGSDRMEYSVRFFDPNSMSEHVRVKETDFTKFATLAMKDFIRDADTRAYYYGADREFRTGGPVTSVAEIPSDAFMRQSSEPLYAPGHPRSIKLHLADEDVSHAVIRKYLNAMSMPAHTALVEAAKTQPRDQRGAYLQSMRASFGHFDFEDAVKDLERGGELDSDSARQLLADLEDSTSALR